MNLKVGIGILVSVFFLWLSVRNVDFVEAWRHVQSMERWYLVPYALLIVAEVLIRAWKWQFLLEPTKRCSFWKLNSATLIGLFANNVLPARAGEFVRAYAGARMEGISYSTSFATVVVDRVLDGLTVTAIFLVTLLVQPLPDEIKAAGFGAAAIYLATLIVLIGLIANERLTLRLLALLLRPFPHQLGAFVMRTARTFVEGLGVFRSPRLMFATTLISFAIWAGYALSLYIMFLAFNIDLSILHAFVVLLILTIVLTLPSTPGFVGAMEWAITFGLGLFGVDPDQAFAVAVVYHVTQYLPVTLAGLIALSLARLSVADIAHVQPPPPDHDGDGSYSPATDSSLHQDTPRSTAADMAHAAPGRATSPDLR